MATDWLLVHPPLLGPAILGPLAEELSRRGATVHVPDLRAAVAEADGWPERWVRLAAAAGPADAVLGFSGAGVTLPAVAAEVGARQVVWVDALIPAPSGATEADDDIRARVAGLVRNGRIADWTTWWGPDALVELVPDAGVRAAIEADGHELPGDFYDVAVPVPGTWPEDGARYLQLSPAYDDAAVEARRRGWPVHGGLAGAHLDIANHPVLIADLLG
ncbi:hypothetical protein [Blastococcus sp. CT_GayMR16]|uniref:hypothetical protein n=1 Tax=Blastococcus sp. CT_GayMR16 TaxID=2559607 RepID=UPI001073234A|nr:hypothetical protein [Blastococcus sp. CT_GayMR16]TFV86144.1 hypothetical protein E4P38_17975 [Blastococcus sp. CT_GayMR16]